jgi:hypothetical protein
MIYDSSLMSDYEADPFGDYEERKPVQKEPELPRCVNCTDREVVPDGKNDFVHNDNLKYQCDYGTKPPTLRFAAPVLIG